MTITSIPTRYLGVRTRSRLEARWLCFFNNLNIRVEYENYSFLLDGTPYLPDFYLPDIRMFAEVKPSILSAEEQRKCNMLAEGVKQRVLMLVGPPDFRLYEGITFEAGDYTRTGYLLDIDYHGRKLYDQGRLWSEEMNSRQFLDADAFTDRYKQAVWTAQGEDFREAA